MFMLVDVGVDASTEKVVVSASSDILVSMVCRVSVGCVLLGVLGNGVGARGSSFFSKKREDSEIIFIWRICEKH